MEEKQQYKTCYDIFMGLLALVVVILLLIETTINLSEEALNTINLIDKGIWGIFCIDYFTRLILSKYKLNFIKKNMIDLLSILPFNAMLKSLRIVKIAKVIKLTKIARFSKGFRMLVLVGKFKSKVEKFLNTNNFIYVVYLTIITVLIGAIGISFTEKMTLDNALWWSFVTTTTVGYGDISPSSNVGRIIAVILMLVGIGFIGMLTGTIATFFINKGKDESNYKQGIIEGVKLKLDDFDNLSKDELKDMFNVLNGLKDDNCKL